MGDERQKSDIANAAGQIVGATAGFAMGGPSGALIGANLGRGIAKTAAPPPNDPYGGSDSTSILDILNTITGKGAASGGGNSLGDGGLAMGASALAGKSLSQQNPGTSGALGGAIPAGLSALMNGGGSSNVMNMNPLIAYLLGGGAMGGGMQLGQQLGKKTNKRGGA